MKIYYFLEDIDLTIKQKKKISTWLQTVIQQEGYRLAHLNFVFCSDQYLHQHNKAYLGHDTLTDVITFDYATSASYIFGDIYISVERVKENAKIYEQPFLEELYTVMVHGLLHLLGYDDHATADKLLMREKELFYLKQLLPTLQMRDKC
ncbi:MAG: rRNA maturation RNase YbeY [Amoebophilaceae bacterium]|nr:rRNA maturation RNase YbeY [Amoebophilaceae bacterium]